MLSWEISLVLAAIFLVFALKFAVYETANRSKKIQNILYFAILGSVALLFISGGIIKSERSSGIPAEALTKLNIGDTYTVLSLADPVEGKYYRIIKDQRGDIRALYFHGSPPDKGALVLDQKGKPDIQSIRPAADYPGTVGVQ